ncbi:MAG: serine/threonine protein kinase [Planctomycetes bacterium]|nr:serine/threonine protein kinase [Planctomycetota bacterium]
MKLGSRGCDRRRIEEFLSSDEIHITDTNFISHLERCSECRDYLEQQAADCECWRQAAHLLKETEFDKASSNEFSAATIDFPPFSISESIQSVLASLIPSEDPHRLGRIDGYEITGVVGAGAMGVVLKAIDPSLDRIVALKVMAPHLASHPNARKRFEREAKAAAAVLHANVIPIYAVSSGGAIPYLVMAYIRGGSLQKRIDREGALNTSEILRIGSQVAAGLMAAHDQGLVHRDIKPENIMLGEGVERVTLTDFGLARGVDDSSITQQGAIAGTPQYMSPEQARGESLDQASDLFSLGSVLYTLCTGRVPFRAESSHSVMRKIIDEEPMSIRELNPEIPQWVCGIVGKLMAKDKASRFASAKQVHALLESCLSHVQQPTAIALPKAALELSRPKSAFTLPLIVGVLSVDLFFILWLCGAFGFLAQEPIPQPTTAVSQGTAEPISNEEPLTWKALTGDDVPESYPTESLQAIEGLNKTVGRWGFSGEQRKGVQQINFEGVMQVQGGFTKESISLGSQPMWQITLKWPTKQPEYAWNMTVVPTINPNGVEWLLFATTSNDGKSVDQKYFFNGTWVPESRTLTWTPRSTPVLGRKANPDEKAIASKFTMTIAKDGGLNIEGFQPSHTDQLSGRSAVRLDEYVPPGTDLKTIKVLPNDYKVFFASANAVHLVDIRNSVVAGPGIEKIGCSGNLIFGLIAEQNGVGKPDDTVGYFWLDSSTGEITKGMELGDWQKTLEAKGIGSVLLLKPEKVGPRY